MTSCPYCTPDTRYMLAGGPCVCAPWSRVEHIAPGVTLYCGDSLEVLPALVGRHDVASVVTDPPYGLGAHPDPYELLRCWLDGRPYAAKGAGFMGKEWDAFVPGPEIWRPVMDLLPPGGHMLAAFGTRTYDLGTLAVRLADAEIRDLIAWVYGSGFPKSLDVSKAIDKAVGAEREVVGVADRKASLGSTGILGASREGEAPLITAPATDAARQWEGWGTALKPALEPWVLARKPLSGTIAQTVMAHRTGALNIDACRVAMDPDDARRSARPGHSGKTSEAGEIFPHGGGQMHSEQHAAGRWPANLIHDGSDEVLAGFPASSVTVERKVKGRTQADGVNTPFTRGKDAPGYTDTGSAARFFYCAKASKRDRDEGLDSLRLVSLEFDLWENADRKVQLLVDTEPSPPKVIGVSGAPSADASAWSIALFGNAPTDLSRHATTSTTKTETSSTIDWKIWSCFQRFGTSENTGGARKSTESGASPAGNAARGFPKITITDARMAFLLGAAPAAFKTPLKISVDAGRSGHPTVKPEALMAYLCRLITPPGGTVLDPFMGSGSTGKAAVRAGFGFVGIERDPAYFDIAVRRVRAAWR